MSKDTDALWFPFYIADYLKDTQHLETIEHGAYFLLLIYAWTHDGLLPSDAARLARITGLSPKQWRGSRDVILAFFQAVEDGYRHKRVDEELAKSGALIEQRRAAGRASAEARKGQREGNGRSTGGATEGQRKPNQSQSQSQDDDDDEARDLLPIEDWPGELIAVTDEVCRTAGVRNSQPGHIIANQQVVKGWMDAGIDPATEIAPAIRQALSDTTERITSLKWFDVPVRQAKARKEAQANGHQRPAPKDRWAGYRTGLEEPDQQPGPPLSEAGEPIH